MHRLTCLVLFLLPTLAIAQGPPPAMVVVAPVQKRPVALTQPLVANVLPVTRTTLAAEQEGAVSTRKFEEGARLERGAVLAELDVEVLQAQQRAADASRNSARAELERAKLDAASAEREFRRVESLYRANVAPEKEFNDARTAWDLALATIALREAQVLERQAEVDRIDLQVRKARIVAPFEGVVSRRHIEVGNWLKVGDPVADLVQLNPLWVEVSVPENVIGRVSKGDAATVTIDAMGGAELDATVDLVLPEADIASRTFRVRLLLPNPDYRILPGFFARATLARRDQAPQLSVPKDAILTGAEGQRVVVMREGKAAFVPVKVIGFSGEHAAVEASLEPGEFVVVRGNERAFPGQTLIPTNLGGPPGGGGPGGPGGGPGGPPGAGGPPPAPNASSPATAPSPQ
jgi:RND family efflux transporter MFP subunit